MKEINLKLNKQMIEIDETINIMNALIKEDEQFNQQVNIISYYLDDNTNFWLEIPIFSIVSWEDNYKIIHHYLGAEVFNDIYYILTKNNLIEKVKKENIKMLHFNKYEHPLSFYDLERIYEIIENQTTTDKDQPGRYAVCLGSGTELEYEVHEDYTITLIDWF